MHDILWQAPASLRLRGEGERLINLIAIISILIDAYILVQYKAPKLHLTQSRFDILYDETILAYM